MGTKSVPVLQVVHKKSVVGCVRLHESCQ